jgi:ketosteroid isomerase-like protein
MADTEKNKQIVLEFLEAFTTFDPEVYERYLTADPLYTIGVNVYHGREGFRNVAYFGRTLYPNGQESRTIHHIAAEGDVVAVLMTIKAVTNAGKDYENNYAVHFELEDGKIAKQWEFMDFRVSTDKFDLSALAGDR